MITTRWKAIVLSMIYAGTILLFLTPLFMYFSHDVSRLMDHYPHNIHQTNLVLDPVYELKKNPPTGWVTLKNVSNYGRWAIVLSEDWDFYNHNGFDIAQMQIAFEEILSGKRKRFRGASTISQQMVKNVFLTPERSLLRKIHEMILTQKVEKVLSKDKILEIYLNCIEFGPGIYGIGPASFHYFKKSPKKLNPKEAAFLAMLLPSPKRYYVSFKKKKLTRFAQARIRAILIKMRMGKVLTMDEYLQQLNSRISWEMI